MYRRIMTDIDVKLGIKSILERVENAYIKRSKVIETTKPMLVAVSKTKPVEMILDAYSVGQRHFGENYVQELVDKGLNKDIVENCNDIKWHFIGHLQRNKINKILSIPGLYMVETVDSDKLADSLNSAWSKLNKEDKLRVLVQVNTSGEEEKNGISPQNVTTLYRHILDKCVNLQVDGIMTIGKFGHDYSSGPNPDFIALMKCHKDVCNEIGFNPANLQVSMGMSDDFDYAIEAGSTIVRVGSSIFGYRPKKNEI